MGDLTCFPFGGGRGGGTVVRTRICVLGQYIVLFSGNLSLQFLKKYSANMRKSFVYACLYFSLCYKNGQKQAIFTRTPLPFHPRSKTPRFRYYSHFFGRMVKFGRPIFYLFGRLVKNLAVLIRPSRQ